MTYKEYLEHKKWYQIVGKEMLLDKKHFCLFFEPGKGKTYPTIEAMKEIEVIKNRPISVLIISSPDAIRKMWQPEIVPQKILPEDTYLVTDRTSIGELSTLLLSKKWDVLIVDECHIIKAHNTKIHKLIHRLSKNIEYVWGLTGTPRGNSDIDIWCQFQALNIGGQGKYSYTAWTRAACEFETSYGPYGKFQRPVKIKDSCKERWNELLNEYALFVTYDNEDDMPLLDIEVMRLPYKWTDAYSDALNGIISVGDFATTTQKIVAISKAQQVCNGYIYLPDKTVHRYNVNSKLDILDKIREPKCVIVYKYIADLEDLSAKFGEYATTDVDKFKSQDYEVLLLQCGNCRSFNLQDFAHQIIFYTMDYSFIKFKQMIHRVWRLGQFVNTTVVVLVHSGTVEENIWKAVCLKREAHELYMSIAGGEK